MKKYLLLPMAAFLKMADKATSSPAKISIKIIGWLMMALIYSSIFSVAVIAAQFSFSGPEQEAFPLGMGELLGIMVAVNLVYYLLAFGLAFIISRININTMSFGKYKVILSSIGVFLIIGWLTRPAFMFGVKLSLGEYIRNSGSHIADINGHLVIFALIGGAFGAAVWSFLKRSRLSKSLVAEVHGTRDNKAAHDDRETCSRSEAEARAKTATEQQPETEDKMRERIRREMEARIRAELEAEKKAKIKADMEARIRAELKAEALEIQSENA